MTSGLGIQKLEYQRAGGKYWVLAGTIGEAASAARKYVTLLFGLAIAYSSGGARPR